MDHLEWIKVTDIEPNPFQPREHMDEKTLKSLADTIKEKGVIQPIIVRGGRVKKFQLVTGERRWRATILAGLSEIRAIVTDMASKEVLAISLIENIQREDLLPIEREDAITQLWESGDFKSERELAIKLGLNKETVRDNIEAKSFRGRIGGVPATFPTYLIAETQGLDDKTRWSFLQQVIAGEASRDRDRIRQRVRELKAIEQHAQDKSNLSPELDESKAVVRKVHGEQPPQTRRSPQRPDAMPPSENSSSVITLRIDNGQRDSEIEKLVTQTLDDPRRTTMFSIWKEWYGYPVDMGDFLTDLFDEFFRRRGIDLLYTEFKVKKVMPADSNKAGES